MAFGVLIYAGMGLTRAYHERQASQESQEEEVSMEVFDQPLSEEDSPKIYEESPIDEEGAARIDAIAPVNADDTWTICVYMVGSNLEDLDENDLSYVTDVMVADQKEQIEKDRETKLRSNVKRYSEELAASSLDLPSYFFYPEKPVASSRPVTREVIVAEAPGAASCDIDEMVAETWSDNIIGFDACLMSTLEVTHALDGFADYYALSEENEPGDGWDYTPWLRAMTNDPTMSPAAVARAIADSYTDFYMVRNVNFHSHGIPYTSSVTFSVLDAAKTHELYEAYSDLAKAQLKDAVKDISVLSEIERCGIRATRYALDYSDVFGTVDLGNYVDYMGDYYPDECSRIKKLISESVFYNRQNGGLSDSQGIAVYLPVNINDLNGLIYYLKYIYNISEDYAITALYYYKQAGCLPDFLKEKVKEIADAEPVILDTKAFEAFRSTEPVVTDTGFSIPVSQQLQDLLVGYELEVNRYDWDHEQLINYGRDEYLDLDGEGSMVSGFEGTWICLDGIPLEVEIISSTDAATDYRARVKYNGEMSYLTFSCDNDTDVFNITGIRRIPTYGYDANYMFNTKSNEQVEEGGKIVPIYKVTDLEANSAQDVDGEEITFSEKSGITREALQDGYYVMIARISDQRGDSYYSPVVGATVSGGKVTKWRLDPNFYGNEY